MKLLQIVADGTPGGGTTNVLALTEDLIQAGQQVVFCSQRDSYAVEQAKTLGAETISHVDFFRSRTDRQVVRDLQAAANGVEPTIVHVHGGRAGLAWVRGVSEEPLSRTCYTVRGYHFYRKSLPIRFLAKAAEKRISHAVRTTVHVCQDDYKTAKQHGFLPQGTSATVIRNGIRVTDIPAPASPAPRTEVAVLGRVAYQKNPSLILDLAKRLQPHGFRIHMIGGGDLETSVRGRVQKESIDNVIVHGALPRTDALDQMSKCGTFLLASRWEGLPIAPVEAMQMGLAVVMSDVNGNTEVVRDGIEGRIRTSEDLDGFEDAMIRVINEPKETEQMIASGKQRVIEHFTRQRVVEQHLELYRSIQSA